MGAGARTSRHGVRRERERENRYIWPNSLRFGGSSIFGSLDARICWSDDFSSHMRYISDGVPNRGSAGMLLNPRSPCLPNPLSPSPRFRLRPPPRGHRLLLQRPTLASVQDGALRLRLRGGWWRCGRRREAGRVQAEAAREVHGGGAAAAAGTGAAATAVEGVFAAAAAVAVLSLPPHPLLVAPGLRRGRKARLFS
jgi:hypothetical protein